MNPFLELARALAGKVVVPRLEAKLRQFRKQLASARRLQRELMLRKVRRCQDSAFGRDHHFHEIRSLADFRRNIPIAQYDYYWPYIRRVTEGEIGAMFPERDTLLMFTLSSGTTANPKLIPINRVWMDEYRKGWQLWGIQAFLDHHPLFYARLTGIAGNWDMRRTPSNLPCGMASGLSARMQSPLLKMMYCVPAEVFELDDPAAKYYTVLRLSVPERAGLFATATPATVVQFAKLGDQYRESLIRDIADGTLSMEFDIPAQLRKHLRRRIHRPDPERARELERIVERTGRLYPKDYWDLELVACWLGGTVGHYAKHITHYYGEVARRDIGLLCSEGRFTVPLEDNSPAGVLEATSHYFEFIPESEIDSPQPTVLEAHELLEGQSYFILLTTSCGLYRYSIYDVLRCVGFLGEAPILEFLNKGQRIADMEGEKVSEHQIVEAVTEVAGRLEVPITSMTAVPLRPEESTDRRDDGAAVMNGTGKPHYVLLLEEQDVPDDGSAKSLLRGVDDWLCEKNVMYQGKRADGYVGPPRLIRIAKGSFAAYDRAEIARRGVGEDHYKHPCLVLDPEFLSRFEHTGQVVLDAAPAAAVDHQAGG